MEARGGNDERGRDRDDERYEEARRQRLDQDERFHYKSLFHDLAFWDRLDTFPTHCLTMSGAVSLAVGVILLLGCFFNVILPHYDRVSHSVQTRCKILSVARDEYIDDSLFHYQVKFPLPGIPGLRQGESYCYGSQRCSAFEIGSAHDCYFNTEDHSVRFYTTMSGHHTIRLFSYIVLMFPFLIGACCCLLPASKHWSHQWHDFADDLRETWSRIPAAWAKKDDEYYEGEYDRTYETREMGRGYFDRERGGAGDRGYVHPPYQGYQQSGYVDVAQGGYGSPAPRASQQPGSGAGGAESRGWQSSISYMRMQAGL